MVLISSLICFDAQIAAKKIAEVTRDIIHACNCVLKFIILWSVYRSHLVYLIWGHYSAW